MGSELPSFTSMVAVHPAGIHRMAQAKTRPCRKNARRSQGNVSDLVGTSGDIIIYLYINIYIYTIYTLYNYITYYIIKKNTLYICVILFEDI